MNCVRFSTACVQELRKRGLALFVLTYLMNLLWRELRTDHSWLSLVLTPSDELLMLSRPQRAAVWCVSMLANFAVSALFSATTLHSASQVIVAAILSTLVMIPFEEVLPLMFKWANTYVSRTLRCREQFRAAQARALAAVHGRLPRALRWIRDQARKLSRRLPQSTVTVSPAQGRPPRPPRRLVPMQAKPSGEKKTPLRFRTRSRNKIGVDNTIHAVPHVLEMQPAVVQFDVIDEMKDSKVSEDLSVVSLSPVREESPLALLHHTSRQVGYVNNIITAVYVDEGREEHMVVSPQTHVSVPEGKHGCVSPNSVGMPVPQSSSDLNIVHMPGTGPIQEEFSPLGGEVHVHIDIGNSNPPSESKRSDSGNESGSDGHESKQELPDTHEVAGNDEKEDEESADVVCGRRVGARAWGVVAVLLVISCLVGLYACMVAVYAYSNGNFLGLYALAVIGCGVLVFIAGLGGFVSMLRVAFVPAVVCETVSMLVEALMMLFIALTGLTRTTSRMLLAIGCLRGAGLLVACAAMLWVKTTKRKAIKAKIGVLLAVRRFDDAGHVHHAAQKVARTIKYVLWPGK